ncbi:putative ATP-dependent RNA helicase TDRD12 isoform X1 [Solenopsis invicta]|uniref:putative ATP-dependent RNA helicase TDRD12 isoform X1 n=1 Tax=Solenopsis invicta TaxID=13686 RepID=UPI00193D9271|nr:putative ATP-dependent RNA helicase TDRD12 isoform X1 [Solenopsis invicta]XP_025987861.2 putative ATP-dependent RNA helicase TDRD12 isoform X1 [Solenopsis invicta]XP_025987862.2 putative ATP-dependent RNA helicase TDRD12 isoform X1 [Solenopsis invicta]XP_025987864.2 putative ATP-dependent RNA helicase TDRD12 isoform X1 [Solenopsis invicta]XP_039303142.1 putative ATP-dependent RNA helicase TDRD12 isoform X1 [Solenopsis invicta]XP_039303144.1 putative ATP-dependent RNA helicase TDRD12 isoform
MNKFSNQATAKKIDGIPPTAKKIEIRNVSTPYVMRAHEIEQKHTLYTIQEKLLKFMKTNNFQRNNNMDIKIGDMVFVQRNDAAGIKLPSYVCRGLVNYIKKETNTYGILLVDHGTVFELPRDKFYILPRDFIPDKYLTKTVGVYGILPICINGSNIIGYNTKAVVVEKWTEKAVQFTKCLLSASEVIYFDRLEMDKSNGREYGEFYLIINNDVVSLSEALFMNYYGIYIEGKLLKFVETYTELKEKQWYLLHIKYSRNKEKGNVIQINGNCNSRMKFSLSEKILVQSSIDCDVLSDITDLRYYKEIHQGWNECIKSSRPRKLQSYMWPAINNGLNVVAIGSSQCGKTSGCVMAVSGLIAMHKNETLKNTCPLALILCASSYDVIRVHSMCQSFLRTTNNIRSVAAFNGKSNVSVAAMIYNGCQILVTTPQYLVRFLKENKGLLSFDRLSLLVFDDADIILDKYYKSIAELFRKYKIIENRDPQGNGRPILQIIISATNWTVNIKNFVQLAMSNPYICISSFTEAVVFKSVRATIHLLQTTCKNEKILALLKDNYITQRTAIVCINAKEAEELNSLLILTKKTLLIHENMKSFDIRALQESWMACVCGFYPVLICTDPVLSDLNFTNVQWLIHHSVLSKFRTQFSYRFSLLLDNLAQDAANCKFNIILDEETNVQFPSLIKLIQRMNAKISPEMLDNIKRIVNTLEREKKEYDICDNVKSFGFCEEKNSCEFRHCILSDIDAPMTQIQINDKVKLNVLYIHDTTHFSARIIEHIPHSNDSKKITYCNAEYMKISTKIQSYYGNIENRKMCISTNVGDICVLEETIDTFQRVQIRRIRNDRDCSENVKLVDVRCIDTGIIHECIDVRKLMHIPEELINLPTHVVEIFLANLMPQDEEYRWNHYTNEHVHKWFSDNNDDRSYIFGKVCLHLGNTIWIDDLRIGTKLIGHPDLKGSSLKQYSINDGQFAVINLNHLSKLFQLCKDSGLTEVNGWDISVAEK